MKSAPFSIAIILTLVLGSLASLYLGQYSWVLNLFSHFHLQLMVLLVTCTAFFVYVRHFAAAAIAFIYAIVVFSMLIPASFYMDQEIVMSSNLYYQNVLILNQDIDQINRYLAQINPEIVALVEVPKQLEQDLKKLYEYKNSAQGVDGGRCVIFSDRNYPEVLYPDLAYPVCAIQTPEYQLLVIHPTPPLGKNLLQKQLTHFAEVSEIIQDLDDRGEKFLLVGDFNSGSYAKYFRDYFGDYFKTNFYTWLPRTPFTIPIDHALSNFNLNVSVGPTLGSDHAGLIVDTK